MKYVIVDDEEINLFITKRIILQVLGDVDVVTFKNAGEALRYLKSDLNLENNTTVNLFLDLNMPVLSGWDFLEFFNQFSDEIKSTVHIYVLTSSIDPFDKRRALSVTNVIAYLEKPLTVKLVDEYFKGAQVLALESLAFCILNR